MTSYPVVGYKEIPFFDESYQQVRKILIWYPVEAGIKDTPSPNLWDVFNLALEAPISNPQLKKPLIVISHGYGGSPHQLSWLINKLVYNDHVVVGIQHLDELDGKPQINIWKRAQDIHTLLDKFVLSPFAIFTDLTQVGFAGYSLGGTTGVWLTGGMSTRLDHFVPRPSDAYPEEFSGIKQALPSLDKKQMVQNRKDNRIRAAFLMAPAWAWIFDKKSLQKISTPTYIVASSADNVLITPNNAGFFSKNTPASIYQVIPGKVGHYIFVAMPREQDKLSPNLKFLITDAAGIDRRWIQFEVAKGACDFFQSVFFSNQK
ncbi:MAG: hypothetical protein FJZ63_00475 [Chlamydiae bacterium]|nr:hypothetical protein [Chlamydiota bacterium]